MLAAQSQQRHAQEDERDAADAGQFVGPGHAEVEDVAADHLRHDENAHQRKEQDCGRATGERDLFQCLAALSGGRDPAHIRPPPPVALDQAIALIFS
jgi:hypothetical protein